MSKRRCVELPYPNNLFAKWIDEWRVEAKKKGWKCHYNYEKALKSLKKYPLPLVNGEEMKCTIQYCGDKLAKMLDQRLAKFGQESEVQNEELDQVSVGGDCGKRPKKSDVIGYVNEQPIKRNKRVREYIPAYRSGPYAILLAMYRASKDPHYRGYMTKAELQSEAQVFCDASFTVPDLGTDYTAWSSMSTLTRKGLVSKYSCPAKYCLTENGQALALKMEAVGEERPCADMATEITRTATESHLSSQTHVKRTGQQHVASRSSAACPVDVAVVSSDDDLQIELEPLAARLQVHGSQTNSPPNLLFHTTMCDVNSSQQQTTQTTGNMQTRVNVSGDNDEDFVPLYCLLPEFDIVLCIDYCEAAGVATNRRMPLIQELRRNGISCDLRKLQVGDFVWIAKERMAPVSGVLALPAGREVILNHVIERKRFDDLAQSIKDGRFKEQKFRLKESGLHHVVYLIEDCYHRVPLCLPEQNLRQAVVNTQVLDGFQVKHTQSLNDTVAYLTVMTRTLIAAYKDKILLACPKPRLPSFLDLSSSSVKLLTFEEFSQSSMKNKTLTVSEMFGKQLVQFAGVSSEMAIEILAKYPTLDSLLCAYDKLTSETEKMRMLADIRHGRTDKRLGDKLSKLMYLFYCTS
ncbi:crossover junction endonuclease MUS81-like isoform X2 [Corticium candelabrum]|uniref:crossover junction endonuclease MUS81-like isoform X2 n=1 Tax=Corticium candelabrum TaxID=121492 RepID=UPI002E274A1A|nr:crossover junction endonuclease MUS81-like isoform X2 [Corticium candelabrum]